MLRLYYTVCEKGGGPAAVRALLAAAWRELRGGPMPSAARTASGKPYFPGDPLFFSLSHTDGLAVCAVSSAPVGADAERIRPRRPGLAARVFAPDERDWLAAQTDADEALLALWTRKEAWAKYTGTGLAGDLRAIRPPETGIFTRTVRLRGCVVSICTPLAEEPVPVEK
jgi:phosphopantetheinyl transferase